MRACLLLLRRLAAQNSIVVEPATVEPEPAGDPEVGAPVEAEDVPGLALARSIGEDERDLAAERDGDIVLVLDEVIKLLLAIVGAHLLRTSDYQVTLDRLLVSLEEAENIKWYAAEGHPGRESRSEELLAEFPYPLGVFRIDQRVEQIFTKLASQMRGGKQCVHDYLRVLPLTRKLFLTTLAKKKCWFPNLLSTYC